jgi:hypothetical protein
LKHGKNAKLVEIQQFKSLFTFLLLKNLARIDFDLQNCWREKSVCHTLSVTAERASARNKSGRNWSNCRARLPGKAAGQGCRARLPSKAAEQGCRARLPGKAAECMVKLDNNAEI